MIQKCSTGLVGIEDSADGSAMLRSTSSVITAVLGDTGRPAKITKELCTNIRGTKLNYRRSYVVLCSFPGAVLCGLSNRHVMIPRMLHSIMRADKYMQQGNPGNWHSILSGNFAPDRALLDF